MSEMERTGPRPPAPYVAAGSETQKTKECVKGPEETSSKPACQRVNDLRFAIWARILRMPA